MNTLYDRLEELDKIQSSIKQLSFRELKRLVISDREVRMPYSVSDNYYNVRYSSMLLHT